MDRKGASIHSLCKKSNAIHHEQYSFINNITLVFVKTNEKTLTAVTSNYTRLAAAQQDCTEAVKSVKKAKSLKSVKVYGG